MTQYSINQLYLILSILKEYKKSLDVKDVKRTKINILIKFINVLISSNTEKILEYYRRRIK
jgi:capsule polysaccharide export protein KpsE/RkpR